MSDPVTSTPATPPAPTPGAIPWYSTLPAELQTEASIRTVPDVATLAKNYVSAQKMIGSDRVALPSKNATPEQRAEFWEKIGRPKDVEAYQVPADLKMHENLKVLPERLTEVKKVFHDLGLTQDQGNALLKHYMTSMDADFRKVVGDQATAATSATTALKTEWGANFDSNLDIAKSVVRKFGTPEFMEEIEKSGIGNNPQLIKTMHAIGKMMLEDSPMQHGKSLIVTNATQANQEISQLKMDKEFMTAFQTNGHPGHREAVEKWTNLHRIAYPGTQAG